MQFDFQKEPGLTRWNRNVIKTAQPLVSIITPYYNSGKHIQQTCNCVLDQTFPYFEWIIVNDGSTNEEDVRLLDEIAKQDPRIRIYHKENGGISSARNFGIKHAETDLILPLDADDLIEPPFVEYCWWMLQKNPDAAWAYTNSVGFQGQEYLWHVPFDPVQMKQENLLTATALIRKSALESVGGYNEENKHYNEDWHTWLKMIARGGYPVQSGGEYLFWYRRSDTGVLSLVNKDKEIAKANKAMLESAAAEIVEPHAPIIFPKTFSYHWTQPQISQWDKCVYEEKTKKQILFLFPHLEMGGADKFNLDLIAGLDKEKYDAGIITTIQNTHEWLQAFRKVTPDIFNLANFVNPEDYAQFISYYIKSRKVDVLFVSNSYHGYYLIPWLRQNFPDLAIVDYVHMEEWYWRNGGYARTSGMVAGVTEKTYVCNSATQHVMVEHFARKPDTVETVHIGVDEKLFDRRTTQPGTIFRELNISEERPVVLFVCRLHPQKRPFLMVEIAKKVAGVIPNVVFAVVGSGPQESELQKTVKVHHLENTVFFLGAKKDVRPYYRDAKITLVCSLKEGLSLTAYESCAMGVPVVSADVGGQKDLVDNTVGALLPFLQSESEDMDGRVFPEEEIDSYADAIVKYLSDDALWEKASETCRAKIEVAFTIDKMVNYFNQEFERLVMDETLRQQRYKVAEALQLSAPLAAELYLMEMQMQSVEEYAGRESKESMGSKIMRTLAEEGVIGLIAKALRWIKYKIHS